MLQLQTRWRPTSRLESSVRPRAEHVTAASPSRPAVRLRTWGSRALPPHPVAAHALRTSPPWQLCVPGLARAVLPLPSCLPVSFTDPPSLHAPVACKSLWCPCDPRGGPPPPRTGRCPRPHGRHPHWAHAVPSSGMPLLTPNSCPPPAPPTAPDGSLAPLEGRMELFSCRCAAAPARGHSQNGPLMAFRGKIRL